MTAARANIVFNDGAGSDSLASGLGPATAVNSTTESTTASYSGTTITFSGATDLSGVVAGDLFYCVTSTGRAFSVIASVNDGADTMVIDNTLTGTASGLSWAIGGKRATFDATSSRLLFEADIEDHWAIETETDQTITSTIAWVNEIWQLRAVGTRRNIIGAFAGDMFTGAAASQTVSNLKFYNTTSAAYQLWQMTGGGMWFNDCVFGTATYGCVNAFWGNNNSPSPYCTNCVFENTSDTALKGRNSVCRLWGCVFIDCYVALESFYEILAYNNIFDNTPVTIDTPTSTNETRYQFVGNLIYNTTSHAFRIQNDSANYIRNNVFVSIGGYGIYESSGTLVNNRDLHIENNAYYNMTSGERSAHLSEVNEIILTADPFVDAANSDFNLNDTAGGGTTLRAHTETVPA